MNTIYWITFGPCTKKSQTTNIQFPGSKRDLIESILHILRLHWAAWEYGEDAIQAFPDLEEIIFLSKSAIYFRSFTVQKMNHTQKANEMKLICTTFGTGKECFSQQKKLKQI